MKEKKLFLPCVLIVMVTIAVFMAGCAHTGNISSNGNVSGNGSIEVTPTGSRSCA